MQSTLHPLPSRLAIVMDGNGRWATARGLPRATGHAAGARAVQRIVDVAVVAHPAASGRTMRALRVAGAAR